MNDAVILWIGLWAVVFGVSAGVVARERGKSFFDGLVIGALFGPFGVLWAFIRETEDGTAVQRKPCPQCAELILPEAKLCPFCRSSLAAD